MTSHRKIPLYAATLVATLLVGLANPAPAAFKIQFQQAGYATQTVQDNNAPDLDSAVGAIVLGTGVTTFKFGTYEARIIISQSNSPGTTEKGQLQIDAIELKNIGGTEATLSISVTDTGFNAPSPPLILQSLMTGFLNSGTGTVSFTSYADQNNAEFGQTFATATMTSPTMTATAGPVLFNLAASRESFDYTGVYSMSNVAEYTLSAGAVLNVSAGKTTLVTPAPPAILAFLVGLPLIGLAVARRRGRSSR